MEESFRNLLQNAAYRDWFRRWWEADYSISGCEERGLDWTYGGRDSRRVAFGGREWDTSRAPPHDLEGRMHDGAFERGRPNINEYIVGMLRSGREEIRIDGSWVERINLHSMNGPARLSGAAVFVMQNLSIDTCHGLAVGFRNSYVAGKLSLISVSLSGRAVFTGSHVDGGVYVRQATSSSININKAKIKGGLSIVESIGDFDFSESSIKGDVVIDSTNRRIFAKRCVVDGGVQYIGIPNKAGDLVQLRAGRVTGRVNFIDANIDVVDLTGGVFGGGVALRGGSVNRFLANGANINGINEVDRVVFGDVEFNKAAFDATINWKSCEIGRFQAVKVHFMRSVIFDRCVFGSFVGSSAEFSGESNIIRCTFSGEAMFSGSKFGADTSFRGTAFHGKAMFIKSKFSSSVTFVGESADIPGSVAGGNRFSQISFQAAAFRAGSGGIWCADFDGRNFTAATIFDGCEFVGVPRFFEVDFHEDVSFRYTKFLKKKVFKVTKVVGEMRRHANIGVGLRAILNTWNKNRQQYEMAYSALKKRMAEVGSAKDERRFLALELRARRGRIDPEVRPLESILSFVYDWTSEYGESIWKPIVATLGVVAIAGAIFYYSTPPAVTAERSLEFAVRQVFKPFDVWSESGEVLLPDRSKWWVRILGGAVEEVRVSFPLKIVASLESMTCLTLLFLAALAIRRRFRLS